MWHLSCDKKNAGHPCRESMAGEWAFNMGKTGKWSVRPEDRCVSGEKELVGRTRGEYRPLAKERRLDLTACIHGSQTPWPGYHGEWLARPEEQLADQRGGCRSSPGEMMDTGSLSRCLYYEYFLPVCGFPLIFFIGCLEELKFWILIKSYLLTLFYAWCFLCPKKLLPVSKLQGLLFFC